MLRMWQVVFWGNPTTPGHVDSVDYFMSGDVMEIDVGQTHYTEQLIRIDGQAIWYYSRNACGGRTAHSTTCAGSAHAPFVFWVT